MDVHSLQAEEAAGTIACFSELIKSPEHIHTYRISPLSLWNAASMGLKAQEVQDSLALYSRFPVPENVNFFIRSTMERYGLLKMVPTEDENYLALSSQDDKILREIGHMKGLKRYLRPEEGEKGFLLKLVDRGTVKAQLLRGGFPVEDLAPLKKGDHCPLALREKQSKGKGFQLRDYQKGAVRSFLGQGQAGLGFGTVVVPCGGGKTVIAMAVMAELQTKTLILTTNVVAVHQWKRELLDKTDIPEEKVGEYTGDKKEVRPITIATYQILVWRKDRDSDFPHFSLFRQENWGLVVYDEVHLLPAPVFRVTAEIQSLRRLGLTATLVREDGAEEDVFSLVGPKRYDIPWKELEKKGWIATAHCHEIRLDMPEELKAEYIVADRRLKFRLAAENPHKRDLVLELVKRHKEDSILVIGQYLRQLEELAKALKAPLITGKTPNPERESIYEAFRKGKTPVIVVSKVANFAIDLPDASVAIQVSGTFGSRQEEAQRLGRILRPKEKSSWFYSLITRHTLEEQYGANRQQFLTEQGYRYTISLGLEDQE